MGPVKHLLIDGIKWQWRSERDNLKSVEENYSWHCIGRAEKTNNLKVRTNTWHQNVKKMMMWWKTVFFSYVSSASWKGVMERVRRYTVRTAYFIRYELKHSLWKTWICFYRTHIVKKTKFDVTLPEKRQRQAGSIYNKTVQSSWWTTTRGPGSAMEEINYGQKALFKKDSQCQH